ncbi:MAG: DUF2934 domain-containing protein [Steroidobacteraceae bacterium]|jgi:hypothetical protein
MTTSKRNSRRAGGAAEDGIAAAPVKTRTRRAKAPPAVAAGHEDVHASIALAAYFRSEQRGFAPGYELEDWLAAERDVNRHLQSNGGAIEVRPEPG